MPKKNNLRVIVYENDPDTMTSSVLDITEHTMPTDPAARRRKFMRVLGQQYDLYADNEDVCQFTVENID